MQVQAEIETKLGQSFALTHCEVINESHMHSVPANSETHFKLVVVSADFEAKRKVARHQAIYQCLAQELDGPVHALAMHLYTPEEWQQANVPNSPNCKGGSK